jgi:hypothetical protein
MVLVLQLLVVMVVAEQVLIELLVRVVSLLVQVLPILAEVEVVVQITLTQVLALVVKVLLLFVYQLQIIQELLLVHQQLPQTDLIKLLNLHPQGVIQHESNNNSNYNDRIRIGNWACH